MNITFDSNVWEKLVLAKGKTEENNKYANLRSLVEEEKIQPYICEIAISLESIMKKDRANFWNKYEPKIEHETIGGTKNNDGTTMIHNRTMFSPDNEKHPGLHPKLINNLELANELGFKVLRMTNFGTVRSTQIPKEMYIDFQDIDDFWKYAEKLSNCANYIAEIKCGSYDYSQFKTDNNVNGMSVPKIIQRISDSKKKVFAKSVAEWVDGDSIAAHYAYGNNIFCTEDRGKSAGSKSVFSANNLSKIKERYKIEVLSINEVLAINL